MSADNSGSIPTAFTDGFAAGSSGVALRGLTVNSTLVLIDGRRAANYALSDDGQRGFVDLNTIPLNAVDRIEVLKDGASALYGADAIAGVVNIIMKKDFHGQEVEAEAGTSQHGGGTMERISGLAGTGNLPTDKYNAYLSFEYERDDRILASARGFPFNTANLSSAGGYNYIGGQPALDSGSIYGTVTPGTFGTPGNILTGTALPGALAQPLNACGKGTAQVVDPTQGTYCAQNFVSYLDDQPMEERFGLNGHALFKINMDTEAYMSASFYENKVTADGAPSQIQNSTPNNTSAIALPATLPNGSLNPNDPFAASGEAALINYAFGDIPNNSLYDNQNYRLVGGIRGSAFNWDYDSAIVVNHTSLQSTNNGLIDYNQLVSDIVNGTYNFNHALGPNSAATLSALSQSASKTSTTDLDSIDFRANRELMHLPGGPLGIALGGEYRYEATRDPDLNPNLEYQGLGVAHTIGQHDVSATYAELDAPVLKTLELSAAVRYDHYSDFADHGVTPKAGFKYTPIDQVALRGTFSEGFRAPSFAENGSSSSEGFITYAPPQNFSTEHGNDGYVQNYNLALLSSANPKIGPEKAKNFTLGTIFQPIKPVSLSADYYYIRKTGIITQADPSIALNDYFNGIPIPAGYSITLDNPDPAYPNAPPRPIVVSSPYVNADALQTEGFDVDMQVDFRPVPFAKVISELNVTEIATYKFFNSDGSADQYVGTQAPYILSSGAGTPRYRASWANTLIMGKATVTGTTYFVSGYNETGVDATGDSGTVTGCLYTGTAGNPSPSKCRVNSFIDFDLTGEYKVTRYLDVFGAVENLFDNKPPLDPANYAGNNYNPTWSQAGIIGRFFKAGFRIHFK